MNITRLLAAVFVIPEYAGRPNVVRRVQWILRFERDGFHSDAFVETFLDIDDITNFIPANEIGNERVLQWAYDTQGGDAFVAQLQPFHEERIAYQQACAGQESYTDGFDTLIQQAPVQMPATVL